MKRYLSYVLALCALLSTLCLSGCGKTSPEEQLCRSWSAEGTGFSLTFYKDGTGEDNGSFFEWVLIEDNELMIPTYNQTCNFYISEDGDCLYIIDEDGDQTVFVAS